jgi:hypothetical protein
MILYRLMFFLMLISLGYISLFGADLKTRIVAILFLLSNTVLFWR